MVSAQYSSASPSKKFPTATSYSSQESSCYCSTTTGGYPTTSSSSPSSINKLWRSPASRTSTCAGGIT